MPAVRPALVQMSRSVGIRSFNGGLLGSGPADWTKLESPGAENFLAIDADLTRPFLRALWSGDGISLPEGTTHPQKARSPDLLPGV